MLKRLGVESRFVDGLRVTDAETAQIAEMVLAGSINKEIVGWIGAAGGRAVGLSGKDARLVTAEKVGRDTMLSRIVAMVAAAQRSRAPIQRLADQISGWFVPAVIAVAILAQMTQVLRAEISEHLSDLIVAGEPTAAEG